VLANKAHALIENMYGRFCSFKEMLGWRRIFGIKYRLKIDTLDSSWCEPDYLLLHANFQILKNYVEKQRPDTTCISITPEEQSKTWEEILDLYHWWTEVYPNRCAFEPQPPKELSKLNVFEQINMQETHPLYPKMAEYYENSSKFTLEWTETEQNNLKRLIGIRFCLWT
jgi:hypothetical protein